MFELVLDSTDAIGAPRPARTAEVLKGIVGKRLTYKIPHVTAAE